MNKFIPLAAEGKFTVQFDKNFSSIYVSQDIPQSKTIECNKMLPKDGMSSMVKLGSDDS